jgi:hypothetical protein
MANVLQKIFTPSVDEIVQNFTIQSWHVSQSVDALTGAEAYDITISGSLVVTGSVAINGGTDSTNIGISGGPYPTLTTKIFDGRTKIPLVVDVNIENAYVKPGQSIQVHFKARKNN